MDGNDTSVNAISNNLVNFVLIDSFSDSVNNSLSKSFPVHKGPAILQSASHKLHDVYGCLEMLRFPHLIQC